MKPDNILNSMFSPGGATCTTANTSTQPFSIDAMLAAVKQLDESEPFFQFMTEKGWSPRDGWVLYIPQSMASVSECLPRYVKAHQLGASIGVVAVNNRALGLAGFGEIGDDDRLMMGVRL